MVVHAAVRCWAVLRRTAAHRQPFDLAPSAEVGQRLRARHAGRRRADEAIDVRFHVFGGNAAAGSGAGHVVDVDAKLTRHAAYGWCRRRRRDLWLRRRVGSRTAAATDIDHLLGSGRATSRARRCGAGVIRRLRLFDRACLRAVRLAPTSRAGSGRRALPLDVLLERAVFGHVLATLIGNGRLGPGFNRCSRGIRPRRRNRLGRLGGFLLGLGRSLIGLGRLIWLGGRLIGRGGGLAIRGLAGFLDGENRLSDLHLVAGLDLDLLDLTDHR